MHEYNNIITLNKNSRGCYILDTVKGCSCVKSKPFGCYGDCYAKHIADRYGFDFSNPVKRCFSQNKEQLFFNGFSDYNHEAQIIRAIKKCDMPFIRIGEMGDPSENWEHTLCVCESVSVAKKPIVIITKHWNTMSEKVLIGFSRLNVVFNTSISAMDTQEELRHRLSQQERLSNVCKSVLRVVSCKFSESETGKKLNEIQHELLSNKCVIDTVFRPSTKNKLLLGGVIIAEKKRFLGTTVLASMHKNDVFLGYCKDCPDMCGITLQ